MITWSTAPQRSTMDLSILLVDDDPVARRTIELLFGRDHTLAALDVRIVHASDGRQALDLLDEVQPDLVICDLLMPRMDGFAFCRAVRARTNTLGSVPIVLVSGVYRDQELIGRFCSEVGARFLTKPIAATSLGRTIAEALDQPAADEFGDPALLEELSEVSRAGPAPQEGAAAAGRPSARHAQVDKTRVAEPNESLRLLRENAPSSQGSLSERGLPMLLFDLMDAAPTGTLTVRRGRMRKEIFLVGGQPIGADSNLRQEALGAYLSDRGIIDDAQHQELLAQARERKQRLGSVLIDLGWMPESEVVKHLIGQARMRIMTGLRWTDGEWSFVPGEAFGQGELAHTLDAERAILSGLKSSASLETATAHLDPHAGSRLRLTARGERFRADFEAVFGADVLQAALEAPTIATLYSRPDVETALAAVEALLMTGFADAEAPPATRTPVPVPVVDPIHTLEQLEADGAGATPQAAFDDDLGSGVVAIGGGLDHQTRETERRALLREYLEMHGRTFYELLGVRTDADTATIKRAYRESRNRWGTGLWKVAEIGADAVKADQVRALHARALEVLTTPDLRAEYDRELAATASRAHAVDAELAYLEGVARLDAGRPAEAIRRFQAAVEARPDQAAYHAYLGWARILAGGKAGADREGRKALQTALELDPDLAQAHEFLGRAAATAGQHAAAIQHLERALRIDPARPAAFDLLVQLRTEEGETAEIERLYRRILHRLGDREPALRTRLWTELGDVFAADLADPVSAKIAYVAAARLAPDDVELAKRLAGLGGKETGSWRDTARALLAEWRLKPTDPQRGHSLVELLSAAGSEEEGYMAASALYVSGFATSEVTALVEAHRPVSLPRITRAFDRRALARLRHPDEEDDLEEMVGILSTEGVIESESASLIASGKAPFVPPEKVPEVFGHVFAYVGQVLGARSPDIHQSRDIDGVRMADLDPPALLVGNSTLSSDDRLELAFRLGRSLALSSPGRIACALRTGRQLRPYLLAVLNLAGRPDDDDEDVGRVRSQIERLPPASVVRLRELGERIQSDRRQVNLSRWARAVRATANRIGLLVSGDLVRAGEAIGNEEGPKAIEDLIEFAVSATYADLRTELAG